MREASEGTTVVRFMKSFAYAPDEKGAAGGLPEKVKVGDEELTREQVLERLGNYNDLQRLATQSTQKVSTLEGRVDEMSKQLNVRNQPPTAKPVEPDFDALNAALDKEEAALDPVADDFKARRQMVIERRSNLRKQERTHLLQQVDARVAGAEKRARSTATIEDRRADVARSNRAVFEKGLADPEVTLGIPITDAEKRQLWDAFEGHIGKPFGVWHEDLQAFEYAPAAVAGAIRDVPSVRDKLEKKLVARGRDEGLRMHSRGAEAADATPGVTSSPPPAGEEHYAQTKAWLEAQPPNVQGDYLRKHSEFGDWYLKERSAYHRRMGATSG